MLIATSVASLVVNLAAFVTLHMLVLETRNCRINGIIGEKWHGDRGQYWQVVRVYKIKNRAWDRSLWETGGDGANRKEGSIGANPEALVLEVQLLMVEVTECVCIADLRARLSKAHQAGCTGWFNLLIIVDRIKKLRTQTHFTEPWRGGHITLLHTGW